MWYNKFWTEIVILFVKIKTSLSNKSKYIDFEYTYECRQRIEINIHYQISMKIYNYRVTLKFVCNLKLKKNIIIIFKIFRCCMLL